MARGADVPEVRVAAALAAGSIGRRAPIPELVLCLRYEKNSLVVGALAQTLRQLGSLAGVVGLRTIVQSGDTDTCAPAMAYILESEGIAIPEDWTVASVDEALSKAAWNWYIHGIVNGDTGAIDPEEQLSIARWALHLGGNDLRNVDECRHILARLGVRALEALQVALEDVDFYARVRAMEVLGQLGPVAAPATPRLLQMLHDPTHRPEVLYALGRIGDPRARLLLVDNAKSAGLELRVAAARGLASRPDESCEASLREVLAASMPGGPFPSTDVALLCFGGLIKIESVDIQKLASDLLAFVESGAATDPIALRDVFDLLAIRLPGLPKIDGSKLSIENASDWLKSIKK